MKRNDLLILVTLASLSYALSDVFLKSSQFSSLINSTLTQNVIPLKLLLFLIISLSLTFLNKILAAYILSKYPLGIITASSLSIIIVLSIIFGYIFFNERIRNTQLIGTVLIIIGIYFITFNFDTNSSTQSQD